METVGEFTNIEIDDEREEEAENITEDKWEERIAGNKVLQLKGNVIPRGLVPLERLFNKDDVPLQPSKAIEEYQVGDLNLVLMLIPKL